MGFWDEINKPDDFRNDWYGELTNQIGHTWLGMHCAIMLVFGHSMFWGEIPFKWAVIVIGGISYLCVEIFKQGWKSGDSWFDSLMFTTGVAWPVLTFDGVQFIDGRLALSADPVMYLGVMAFWGLCLAPRVWDRWRRRNEY